MHTSAIRKDKESLRKRADWDESGSIWLFDPMDYGSQASHAEFSGKYWAGSPFPSAGIKPRSPPKCRQTLYPSEPLGSPDFGMRKTTAPHSSILARKSTWSLVSCTPWGHTGSQTRLSNLLSLFTFLLWKKWQPSPGFFLGESQGQEETGGLLSMRSHRVGNN